MIITENNDLCNVITEDAKICLKKRLNQVF